MAKSSVGHPVCTQTFIISTSTEFLSECVWEITKRKYIIF